MGPSNLFLLVISIIYSLRNSISNNGRLTVGIYQFIMLLIFSQARADYYMSPLILVSSGMPHFKIKDFKFLNSRFNNISIFRGILNMTLFAQLLMFLVV